jgi:hypothetical protein
MVASQTEAIAVTVSLELARANVENYLARGYYITKGMSSLFSAQIATSLALAQTENGVRGHIAEIGVYKGRFFIALALSLSRDERAIAIDKFDFPDHGVYDTFRKNLTLHRVPADVVVTIKADTGIFDFASFDAQLNNKSIRFFHLDGDHHRQGLLNDLNIAIRHLHDAGIICVDDMVHPCYPVLGQAVDDFLHQNPEFVVFCVVDRNDIVEAAKFLICRAHHASHYVNLLRKTFAKNLFILPANFEQFSTIVLTPQPRSIDF